MVQRTEPNNSERPGTYAVGQATARRKETRTASDTLGVLSRRDFLFGAAAITLSAPVTARAAVPPLSTPEVAPGGTTITRAAIFPPIGFSRVGNADSWFLAPEVPGLHPEPVGGFKDGADKIKKQVQRYRVYGYDDDRRLVREVSAGQEHIRWQVRVANAKAGWYGFHKWLQTSSRWWELLRH